MMDVTNREARLKRLRMRCWRRGTKEMDMILGPFADAQLASLEEASLDDLERLLSENDQDLYNWVSGREAVPDAHGAILGEVRAFHGLG
jgi:antitoxin CptB